MRSLRQTFLLALVAWLVFPAMVQAQGTPESFRYQAVLRDVTGALIINEAVDVRIGILSNGVNGTLEYEEEHTVNTDAFGLISLNIGLGNSTGNGANAQFSTVAWGTTDMFLRIGLDETQSGTFIDIMATQINAVPYAFHAKTTDQKYTISDLTDVDTSGLQPGHTLMWNGSSWEVGTASITVDTTIYANSAGSATYSDTAQYTLNAQNVIPNDTANYAMHADSANFALTANTALATDSAGYADSANWAWNSVGKWGLLGNDLTGNEYLGTNNNRSLRFQTNGEERMRIDSMGRVGIGTTTPEAQLHVKTNDGFLVEGAFGSGSPIAFSGNRLLWYPRTSHFYSGDSPGFGGMGDYSFGTGFKSFCVGDYSFVMGFESRANGEAAFAGGFRSLAHGPYSLAFGFASRVTSNATAGIAMGRDAQVTGDHGVALGYHPHSYADNSVTIGFQCEAFEPHAFAMGYRARAMHQGSFVYAGQGTNQYLETTADNQFMVRARGGTIFYSSTSLTTGVSLAPAGGAWATVSDRNKKENFEAVDQADVLEKVANLEVTKWNYKAQGDDIVHMGPMAQDFYAAFGLGESDTTITTTDIDGVNLAALQALIQKSKTLEAKANTLETTQAELETIKAERDALLKRLESLENVVESLLEREATQATVSKTEE